MSAGRLAALFALLALAAPVPARAQTTPTLDALLAAYAKIPGLQARYVRTSRSALLVAPVTARGTLYFTRPGYLLQRDDAGTRTLITPTAVHVTRGSKRATMALGRSAEANAMTLPMVWLFGGQRAGMASAYKIAFRRGPDGSWTLRLTPKSAKVAKVLRAIEVYGKGLATTKIVFRSGYDDTTEIVLSKVNPERRFSAAEKKTLFGLRSAAQK
ncbi:MAG: outer membrane lipoprotein carrier protein LolA [Myxococcales bacterium]|nr:outer membrane lipoprotein carrier protein LolA [Myxococcales bacterium]